MTTFGPVGRVVATAALLGVLAWFVLFAGVFGLVGAVVWVGWVLPRGLRDIWRGALVGRTITVRFWREPPPATDKLAFVDQCWKRIDDWLETFDP